MFNNTLLVAIAFTRFLFSLLPLFAGSNDSREMSRLQGDVLYRALDQFKSYMEQFISSLLDIPGVYVILPSIFPSYRTQFDLTNNIIDALVRYLVSFMFICVSFLYLQVLGQPEIEDRPCRPHIP